MLPNGGEGDGDGGAGGSDGPQKEAPLAVIPTTIPAKPAAAASTEAQEKASLQKQLDAALAKLKTEDEWRKTALHEKWIRIYLPGKNCNYRAR